MAAGKSCRRDAPTVMLGRFMERMNVLADPATRRSLCTALLAAAAMVALPAPVAGQPAQKDKAAAEKVFLEGREALRRGEKDLACVKFRSSQALSPSANTLANVAQCEDHEGKLLDSLATWQKVMSDFPEGDDRLRVAKERIASLLARIPQLRLVLSEDLPAGAKILVDGAAMDRAALGEPLKLATGEHAVVVQVEGRREQRSGITLAEGDRKEIRITAGPLATPSATVTQPETPAPPPPVDGRRIGAFVSGGVGLAGLVAAGITGGLLMAQDARIQAECHMDASAGKTLCSRAGIDEIQAAEPLLIVNSVVWGVGIAGVGLGAVLFLTGGKSGPAKAALAPLVVPGGGGASFTGQF
jgi:hypothetical protein